MKSSLRDRFAFWLEQFTWLHPVLLRYDGEALTKGRYVNRVNGHLVLGPTRMGTTNQPNRSES